MTGMENGEEETTYEWDPFDHLAKVEGPTGTASYAFDALERLSERKSGESTQVVHYGDLTDLPTYDANGEGKTTTSYVKGAPGLLEQRSGETTIYPLADSHGDITALIGPTGSVESHQSYDPWGTQLSGPGLEMGYLGAQQRRADPAMDLIQMGARKYAPRLGSFLSEDPMFGRFGLGQSANRFAYALGDPVNNYDLDGRITIKIPDTPIELHPPIPTPGDPIPEPPVTLEGMPSIPGIINDHVPDLPIETSVSDRINDFLKDHGKQLAEGCVGGALGGLAILNTTTGGAPLIIPGIGEITEAGAAGGGCVIGAAGTVTLGLNPVRTR